MCPLPWQMSSNDILNNSIMCLHYAHALTLCPYSLLKNSLFNNKKTKAKFMLSIHKPRKLCEKKKATPGGIFLTNPLKFAFVYYNKKTKAKLLLFIHMEESVKTIQLKHTCVMKKLGKYRHV